MCKGAKLYTMIPRDTYRNTTAVSSMSNTRMHAAAHLVNGKTKTTENAQVANLTRKKKGATSQKPINIHYIAVARKYILNIERNLRVYNNIIFCPVL